MTTTSTKTDKKLSLPDDLAQCHALIEELQATLQATMQEHEREKYPFTTQCHLPFEKSLPQSS